MTGRNPAPATYVGANDEKECDMQCPTDGTTLTMSERSGIEIDYCPQCRGVWLDRGELDKIIERSMTVQAPAQPAPPPQGSYERERDQRREHYDQRYQQQPYRKKKKESWLSEIFD
jgi:Zn-finger nucleic acid-binding protein